MAGKLVGMTPVELPRNQRWLTRLAFDLTRDSDRARDLVQDTFVAALKSPPPEGSHLRPWLAGVLRNMYKMGTRTDVRRERREAASAPQAGLPNPEHTLDHADAARILLEEIERMGEPYRTTLLLRYYEGLGAPEIAAKLGVPAATVRKRNQLALGRLRQRLDARHGGKRERRAIALFGFSGMRPRAPMLSPSAWFFGLSAAAIAVVATVTPVHFGRRAAADVGRAAPSPRAHVGTSRRVRSRVVASVPSARATMNDTCPDLQAMVEDAAVGATLSVPACVYRQRVTILKPLTLVGQPGAEIRGSDVWTEWTPAPSARGTLWQSVSVVPPFARLSGGCDGKPTAFCRLPEQAFVDGQPLDRARGETPAGAEFALDAERHVLLGADPTGHQIEITVRAGWVSVVANDVTVRGFRMRHAAGKEHTFAVINPARHALIADNVLSDAAGPGLTVAGFDHVVEGNEVFNVGDDGIRIEPGRGTVVRNNHVHDAGSPLTSPWWWRGGGITTVLAENARVEGNDVHDIRGASMFVISSPGIAIAANNLHDNWGAGVIIMSSAAVSVNDNRIWKNGTRARPVEAAVFVIESHQVDIARNTLVDNAFGVYVGPAREPAVPVGFDTCANTGEVAVHENAVLGPGAPFVFSGDPRIENSIPPCESVRAERNRVWSAVAGANMAAHNVMVTDAERDRTRDLLLEDQRAVAP